MAYIITRLCRDCVDTGCVAVCPVDCIYEYTGTDREQWPNQLYIHPDECIDCGACEPECPWNAIFEEIAVPEAFKDDTPLNYKVMENMSDFKVPRTRRSSTRAPSRSSRTRRSGAGRVSVQFPTSGSAKETRQGFTAWPMWMSSGGGYQKLLPELLAFDGGARSARPVTGSEDEPSRRWRTAKLPKADRVAGVLRYPLSATAGEKPLPRKGPESFPSWTSPVRPRSPAFRNGTTRSLSAPRRRRRRGDRIDRQALCGPRAGRVHRAGYLALRCRGGHGPLLR